MIVATLGVVIWLSFVKGAPGDADLSYTLANYAVAFSDPSSRHMLLDTVNFSLVTLAVALLFGLPAAWSLGRANRLAGACLVIFTFMTASLLDTGFALAMGWLYSAAHPLRSHRTVGCAIPFGLTGGCCSTSAPLPAWGSFRALGLAPVVFIMTAAVFRVVDPSLEESAADERRQSAPDHVRDHAAAGLAGDSRGVDLCVYDGVCRLSMCRP